MSKKPAALPLFGDAYLADTQHLTTEEHGAYLLLMLAAWRQNDCALPADDRKLARIAGLSLRRWKGMRATIMAFWSLEGDRIFQGRLRKERDYVENRSTVNASAANARWRKQTIENTGFYGCDRIAPAIPNPCETDAPPPPPPQDRKKEEVVPAGASPEQSRQYAFEGSVIRLNHADFAAWRERYSAVPDLVAELGSLDDWLRGQEEAKRKRWFHVASGSLNKKHQAALAEAKAAAAAADTFIC